MCTLVSNIVCCATRMISRGYATVSSVQVARVPWRLLPTLLLISVVLTGCLTLQPNLPGTNPTVTVSGTVRTAVESHHVAATAADHTVQATSAPMPVQAMRV